MNTHLWEAHQEITALRAEIRLLRNNLEKQRQRAERWRAKARTERPVRHVYSVRIKEQPC